MRCVLAKQPFLVLQQLISPLKITQTGGERFLLVNKTQIMCECESMKSSEITGILTVTRSGPFILKEAGYDPFTLKQSVVRALKSDITGLARNQNGHLVKLTLRVLMRSR